MVMHGSRRGASNAAAVRVLVAGAAVLVVGVVSACTGAGAPTPRPTTPGSTFTTIADAGTANRLVPPERSTSDVARLLVNDADGLFWRGSAEPGSSAPVRAGQQYRLTGRCLPATAGGTLVVDVLGPGVPRSDGRTPQPMSGLTVATITVPCDGTEARLDLPDLPVGSGELMVAEATRQVATGWVLLARVA